MVCRASPRLKATRIEDLEKSTLAMPIGISCVKESFTIPIYGMITSKPVMDARISFQEAADLLRLAEMATGRHLGVGLADIESEFTVDRRTAQRMTEALEETSPNCITRTDDERRKFWKINFSETKLMLAQGLRDSERTGRLGSLDRSGRTRWGQQQGLRTSRNAVSQEELCLNDGKGPRTLLHMQNVVRHCGSYDCRWGAKSGHEARVSSAV
jgi:hypothetical protein